MIGNHLWQEVPAAAEEEVASESDSLELSLGYAALAREAMVSNPNP